MMEKIVVLGGGESGCGAALLAQQKGFKVFLSDIGKIKEKYKNVLTHNAIEWEEEKHSEKRFFEADIIVKSPGISDTIPLIQDLKKASVPIISEIEFAARYTNAKIIGITGSNGKTTTTLIVGHMLKKAGLNVGIAGNVGDSFAYKARSLHYNSSKKTKGIFGNATKEQIADLNEELGHQVCDELKDNADKNSVKFVKTDVRSESDIKNLIENYIKDINTTRIVDSALNELIEKVIEENKFDFCLPFD